MYDVGTPEVKYRKFVTKRLKMAEVVPLDEEQELDGKWSFCVLFVMIGVKSPLRSTDNPLR